MNIICIFYRFATQFLKYKSHKKLPVGPALIENIRFLSYKKKVIASLIINVSVFSKR